MNSIRISDTLRRAWLEVSIRESTETNVTVAAEMFDDTPFSISVHPIKVEVDPTDAKRGLLEVGYVGEGSGYSEIVLPAPALTYGHNVRVKGHHLVRTPPKVFPKKFKKEVEE